MNKRGRLIVLSAPSGGGKSTIIKELLRRRPQFIYSVSCTTRPKRGYEIEGIHYHFLSREKFQKGVADGRFLEWAEVHGDLYGSDRYYIEAALADGKDILLDLDVHGGEQVRKQFPASILIFLYPPSVEELRRRLRLRGSDDEASIEKRLARYPMEKEIGDRYPYRVLNDDIDRTVNELIEIIESHPK